jgi:hypothetical protein
MSFRLEKTDWKFATNFILAIIAIAAPLWLWRADLDAKGVNLTLLGSFELVSPISEAHQGLRISYNGKDLREPFSSIIAVGNSGAKPIHASDFEGPIKITVAKPAKLLRSQMVRREPQSLEPVVFTNEQMLTIEPMLLNPGDLLTLEILTTGGKPQFASRGRIAGVPDVKIEESRRENSLGFTLFRIRLDSPLGWLLLLYASFGAAFTCGAAETAFRSGKHSFLVTLTGLASISLMFGIYMGWMLRLAMGFSRSNAVILCLTLMGAGMFVYLRAMRLLPARQ